MSDELEIQMEETTVQQAFFDKVGTAEQRRMVALDYVIQAGALPDKLAEHAAKVEKYLLNEQEKKAKLKVVDD